MTIRCNRCKTGKHVIRKTVEVRSGVLQKIAQCNNCGMRWKSGRSYQEQAARRIRKARRHEDDKDIQGAS